MESPDDDSVFDNDFNQTSPPLQVAPAGHVESQVDDEDAVDGDEPIEVCAITGVDF